MKWLKWLKWPLMASVLVFLIIAISQMDGQGLIDSFRQIPIWSVVVLFCLQIVTQLLINLQWQRLARTFGSPISFPQMLYINARAEMLRIAPGGYIGCDVFRAVHINRAGNCSGEEAAAVVAIQKLFSLSAFFAVSLLSVGFFIGQVPWLADAHLRFLLYGILIFVFLILTSFFLIPRPIAAFITKKWKSPTRFKWAGRLRGFLLAALNRIIHLRQAPAPFIVLTIISLSIWLLFPIKLFILAAPLIPAINPFHIGAATFISYTVAAIPIFPGGLGGFEATMTALLVLMGFFQSDALVITVLFRFATFWYVFILAIFFMIIYKLKERFYEKN